MKRCLAVMLCTILITSLALTLTSCGKSDMKAIEKKG